LDLTTILKILRGRFLVPTLTVLILLSAGMAFVWGEYKEVLKQKDSMAADRKVLYEDRVAFEKERASAAASMAVSQAELEKREYLVKQAQGQLAEKLSDLRQRADQYGSAEARLKIAAQSVSAAQLGRDAEERLLRLMSEFSALGVSLNSAPCGDAAALQKYNVARAKYSEAHAVAEANGLTKKYKAFFATNEQLVWSTCN